MAAAMRGDLVFRPAAPEDAAFAADVMTAVRPASPVDPVVLRYWWTQPDESLEFARFVVLRGGGKIGFAMTEHARWGVQPERIARREGPPPLPNRNPGSMWGPLGIVQPY